MSSQRKDARWEAATQKAESCGLKFEDFSYTGWQKLLDRAERYFRAYPEHVEGYAAAWIKRGRIWGNENPN